MRFFNWTPRIEFVWLKDINFYPTRPDLTKTLSLCIGSKTRTIGDALVLSTLPRKLKAKHPNLRITTYPRGFNPVVFQNNPFVDNVEHLPDALYGDDTNWESGHLIQLKEKFFEVPVCDPPRPEIFLAPHEREEALSLKNTSKPIVILHAWGHTWTRVAHPTFWSDLVRSHPQFSFWQVGVRGQKEIPGCERYFLFPRSFQKARKLFALTELADAFIGVNSGPMHVAAAFQIPSLIVTEQGDIQEIFENRSKAPYFLYRNWAHGFLYPQNQHLDMPSMNLPEALQTAQDFLNLSK